MSSFSRTRYIDSRDKKNRFARNETSDQKDIVSKYCKQICSKLFKITKDIMNFIWKFIISMFIDISPQRTISHNGPRIPVISGEKPFPGVYIFDDIFPPRDKVFNEFKKLNTNIIQLYHSGKHRECMDACTKYIHQMNSPAYMNFVKTSVNEKEFYTITTMMRDAYKYGNDALLLLRTF
jgi:hypothetical protein